MHLIFKMTPNQFIVRHLGWLLLLFHVFAGEIIALIGNYHADIPFCDYHFNYQTFGLFAKKELNNLEKVEPIFIN